MKVYIASRFNKKQEVRKLYKKFEELGYSISGDWTLHKSIKPYSKNSRLAREYAIEDINAVKESDIFIVISDEGGTGMYTELGVAILSSIIYKRPKIYVVGKTINSSMFYFHPSVRHKRTISEVLEELEQ